MWKPQHKGEIRLTFYKAHADYRVEYGLEGSQEDAGRPIKGSFDSLWEIILAWIKEVAKKKPEMNQ